MGISDQHLRMGTVAGGVALIAIMTYLRFCGSLTLPPKPPPPQGPSGTESQLFMRSSASPEVYKTFLKQDAASAGVRAPTLSEMARKLPYRVDEARHALQPGNPPIELAGLRLHLERSSGEVVLVVDNRLGSAVAYHVVTAPSSASYHCDAARPLPFDAMVIAKGASVTRTECTWHEGMSIIVSKVETLEVSPLSAWYLDQVPPTMVGIDERVARGHRGLDGGERCTPVMSQVVRTALDRGDLAWRDLVDFYARHRCQSYHFPLSYKALKSDGERPIPATGSTM